MSTHPFSLVRQLDKLKKVLKYRISETRVRENQSKLKSFQCFTVHNMKIRLYNQELDMGYSQLKQFCLFQLLICIFYEGSAEDLLGELLDCFVTQKGVRKITLHNQFKKLSLAYFFKLALDLLPNSEIDHIWLMKLFMIGIFGIHQLSVDLWTAILAIVDRNIRVREVGGKETVDVMHPPLSYYWLGVKRPIIGAKFEIFHSADSCLQHPLSIS